MWTSCEGDVCQALQGSTSGSSGEVELDLWEAARRFASPAPRVSLPLKERDGVPGVCTGAPSLPLPAHSASPASCQAEHICQACGDNGHPALPSLSDTMHHGFTGMPSLPLLALSPGSRLYVSSDVLADLYARTKAILPWLPVAAGSREHCD